jgi:short-subunit dehydrogenase
MASRSLQQKRVLITGASSGIGRALAMELGRYGVRLLLTARRDPLLYELEQTLSGRGIEAARYAGDIAQPSTREGLLEMVRQRWGALDILVNNAGLGAVGPFGDACPARLEKILQVNFVAPVELIRTMLPLLRQGRQPVIVNVGSVLGLQAVPNKSEYCASKFALAGFSDSLRMELRSDAMDVLLVSPSTTRSDFFEHLLAGQDPGSSSAVARWLAMRPEYVARRIALAIRRRKRRLVLPTSAGWCLPALRLFPRLADWFLTRRSS